MSSIQVAILRASVSFLSLKCPDGFVYFSNDAGHFTLICPEKLQLSKPQCADYGDRISKAGK